MKLLVLCALVLPIAAIAAAPTSRFSFGDANYSVLDNAGTINVTVARSDSTLGAAPGRGRLVAATVHARDTGTQVAYWLRYRVRLVRRDRWYVADLNAAAQPGSQR